MESLKRDSSSSPIIALVDRGDCFFIEKAFNAEKAGAAALIVADDREEALVTMVRGRERGFGCFFWRGREGRKKEKNSLLLSKKKKTEPLSLSLQAAPDDRPDISKLKEDITIPTALVTQATGKRLKEALDKATRGGGSGSSSSKRSEKVLAELDWTDAVAHPDARVEWELWSTPDDGCGASCDRQGAFKRVFERQAVELEKGGFAQFTPRFVTRRCSFGASDDDRSSPECQRNCIHRGRYCSMTPVGDDYKSKYGGKEVVTEAKRQLCAFEVATKAEKPWSWWRFSVKAAEDCTMRRGKFGDEKCLREALDAAGIDHAKVEKCVGDVSEDEKSEIMETNLDAQGLGGSSSRVLITPTVVINGAQYRGRLDAPSVTRGLCAGFSEATEPPACLTSALEVNECASADNGGCWKSNEKDEKKNGDPLFSACVDTFRGFKCQCPFGFRGDGRASGPGKHSGCEDIDECAEGTDQCDQECENTPGGYTCSCREGFKQVGGNSGLGACFPADGGVRSAGAFGGRGGAALSVVSFVGVVAAAAGVALLAGIVVHRGRARAEARAEVAAILRQYMPLEGDDGVNGDGGGSEAGSGFLPFGGRSRGNTASSSSSAEPGGAFFGAFAEGAAGAHSSHHGGSGNYSSGSEVGLTPTASSAEAEAEREAAEKNKAGAPSNV